MRNASACMASLRRLNTRDLTRCVKKMDLSSFFVSIQEVRASLKRFAPSVVSKPGRPNSKPRGNDI